MRNIHPCLWFASEAEEAANFYCSIFPNSKITSISHYGPGMMQPEGTVLTVSFELNGAQFMALNGGPLFTFSEAISLVSTCDSQAEVDAVYDKLSADPQAEVCGWLKDKYGLSWQIITDDFERMMTSGDPERFSRVMAAVMQMKRLDIAAIKRAWDGE